MKPFNLEEAKAGKPMITRDRRKAVFIAYDEDLNQPLVCKAFNPNGGAVIETFNSDGCYYGDIDVSYMDLFMVSQKKTVWVNLYDRGGCCFYYNTESRADEAVGIGRIGGKAYPVEIDV